MEIASTKHHHFSECESCGHFFGFKGSAADAITALSGQYEAHLAQDPKCKEWHDNLPTIDALRNAFRG